MNMIKSILIICAMFLAEGFMLLSGYSSRTLPFAGKIILLYLMVAIAIDFAQYAQRRINR